MQCVTKESPFALYVVVAIGVLAFVVLVLYLGKTITSGLSQLTNTVGTQISAGVASAVAFATSVANDATAFYQAFDSSVSSFLSLIDTTADRMLNNAARAGEVLALSIGSLFDSGLAALGGFAEIVVKKMLPVVTEFFTLVEDFVDNFFVTVAQFLKCAIFNSFLFKIIQFIFNIIKDAVITVWYAICIIWQAFTTTYTITWFQSICSSVGLTCPALNINLFGTSAQPTCSQCPSLYPCCGLASTCPGAGALTQCMVADSSCNNLVTCADCNGTFPNFLLCCNPCINAPPCV